MSTQASEENKLTSQRQNMSARLMIVGGLACGFIGLTVGMIDRSFKLGVVGWFTGGALTAVLAVAILIDSYRSTWRQR